MSHAKMRRWGWMAVLAAAFPVCVAAQGDSQGWHPTASLDFLAPGNMVKQTEDTLNGICQTLIGNGATSCAYNASVDGAYGGRVGAYYGDPKAGEIGFSLGYLYGGPQGAGKGTIAVTPTGNFSTTITDNTVRLLLQLKRNIPINDDWRFMLGGGVGWAGDSNQANYSSSGSIASLGSGIITTKEGWGTWEFSPAIAYGALKIGARYVGFARGGFAPWNTYGGFIGFGF